jgi:cysteine desulfurase
MMTSQRDVYLDYSATTPTDPRVIEKMIPYLAGDFGNTSSLHSYGRKAEDAVETAREVIAKILNCKSSEIIFTSGGSESDNLAIRGVGFGYRDKGRHLITTPVEHSAVGNTFKQLAQYSGFDVTFQPVNPQGLIDVEELMDSCQAGTTFVSVIYANNEIGSIHDLKQISEHLKLKGVILHTDAVQAAGQLSLDVEALGVDLMSISAHKFYGPKGVGALYCREGVSLVSSQTGGSHEQGRRAGTVNTAGIVAMAEALRLAEEEKDERVSHYRILSKQLQEGILAQVSGAYLTGHPDVRLPSHSSFVFEGVDSTRLLMHLDMAGIAASGGSACKTGNPEPSSVLLAMGYPADVAIGSLRLSLGKDTTENDIEYAIDKIVHAVEKVRKLRQTLS